MILRHVYIQGNCQCYVNFVLQKKLSMLCKLCPQEESDLFIMYWTKQFCKNLKFSHLFNILFTFKYCILNPVNYLMCLIVNLIQSYFFFSTL